VVTVILELDSHGLRQYGMQTTETVFLQEQSVLVTRVRHQLLNSIYIFSLLTAFRVVGMAACINHCLSNHTLGH